MNFFYDVSELVQIDHRTGIQRVVRSLLTQLLAHPPKGYIVEPVFAKKNLEGYFYARKFIKSFLSSRKFYSGEIIDETPIEPQRDDIFLRLELQPEVVFLHSDYYADLRSLGVKVYFGIYDLLPIWMPQYFPEGIEDQHTQWLRRLARADGLVCISRAVTSEVAAWLHIENPKRLRPLQLGWFHLGADIEASTPSEGMPTEALKTLAAMNERPSFLMVSTIEPRKGHKQTLAAFERLWQLGIDVNLVIAGRHGWLMDDFVNRLRSHTERSKRLHWLNSVSDEYLNVIYAASRCLIAPSEGEGFGLPLIEAAQHQLPIIARDLPVFREVAGDHAYFFSGMSPEALSAAVQAWLVLNASNQAPSSAGMPRLTWKQSTEQLLAVILDEQWHQAWVPVSDGVLRMRGSDARLLSQFGKRSGQNMHSTGVAGHLIYGPYVHLKKGKYELRLTGYFDGLPGPNANIEVAMQGGKTVLARSSLYAFGLLKNDVRKLVFEATEDCTDLEIRVWVEACNAVKLSLIEVYPLTGA